MVELWLTTNTDCPSNHWKYFILWYRKEVEGIAKKVHQPTRNGAFEHPMSMLPPGTTRVAEISWFNLEEKSVFKSEDAAIPGNVTLVDGKSLKTLMGTLNFFFVWTHSQNLDSCSVASDPQVEYHIYWLPFSLTPSSLHTAATLSHLQKQTRLPW